MKVLSTFTAEDRALNEASLTFEELKFDDCDYFKNPITDGNEIQSESEIKDIKEFTETRQENDIIVDKDTTEPKIEKSLNLGNNSTKSDSSIKDIEIEESRSHEVGFFKHASLYS